MVRADLAAAAARSLNFAMKIAACLATPAALFVDSTVSAAPVEIPDYAQDDRHTYCLPSPSDWIPVDAAATRLGGNLATIDSTEENDFLQTHFARVAANDPSPH